MPYWRDPDRPTIWTKDGRLVYVKQPKKDPIIWALNLGFKRLINHKSVDDFTNHELYRLCVASQLRLKELEREQNRIL